MCVASKAREALSDCRFVHDLLEGEVDHNLWRIYWVSAIALIRTVGHVIDKIDGENPHIKKAAAASFDRWKLGQGDDVIFTEFIEQERNTLLKEYEFGPDLREEVQVVAVSDTHSEIFGLNENIFRPLQNGQWQNEDARDIYAEAIAWWEKQIHEIELQASLEK